MRRYLFLLIFMFFNINIKAQTKLYLKLNSGYESHFSKFENKKEIPEYIKTANFSTHLRYILVGYGLFLDINQKFALELITELGGVGDGLRAISHSDSVLYESKRRRTFRTFNRRIILRAYKKIGQVKIRKGDGIIFKLLDAHRRSHFFGFEIEAIAGFSYDWIFPFTENVGSLSIQPPPPNAQGMIHSDDISLAPSTTWWDPRGWGIQGGINLQFRNSRGNRSLQIGLLYHQGLNKRIVTTWQTAVNGVQYPDFNTVSRGSMMSIYVGMPIRLITFGGEPKRY